MQRRSELGDTEAGCPMNASEQLGRINAQLRAELESEAQREHRRGVVDPHGRTVEPPWEPLSADDWERRERAVAKFNHYARQSKRPDQVQFSATVFFVAFAITFAVVVGAWLWRVWP